MDPEGVVNAADQFVDLEGLFQGTVGAEVLACARRVQGRHDNDRPFVTSGPRALVEGPAVHIRHIQVEKDEVGLFGLEDLQCFFTVSRLPGPKPLVLEDHSDKLGESRIIVDD